MLFLEENKHLQKEFLEFEKASIDLQDSKLTMSVAEMTDNYARSLLRYYSIQSKSLPIMMIF